MNSVFKLQHHSFFLWILLLVGAVGSSACRTVNTRHKTTPPATPKPLPTQAKVTPKPKATPRARPPSARPRVTRVAKQPTTNSKHPLAHAVLLNGGASAQQNYYSHVLFLRMMRKVLRKRGLKDKQITIFASDGDDPSRDQTILAGKRTNAQLLFYRRPESQFFSRRLQQINTTLQGKQLYPATYRELRSFFRRTRWRLRNDKRPLLLFVTDHGTRNRYSRQGRNHNISLWNEELSVRRFHRVLAQAGRRKVISVMSQCFSGSFAWSIFPRAGRLSSPRGDRCGFYATTPNRPAYGCFPDTKLQNEVGHAYRFIHAMQRARSFDEAHRYVLLNDQTPDVPMRSSDNYLSAILKRYARLHRLRVSTATSRLFQRYQGRPYPGMQQDLLLMGQMAKRFGLARPVDLPALHAQMRQLRKQGKWWERVKGMWRSVFTTARDHYLKQWYHNNPGMLRRVRQLLYRGRYAALDTRACTAQQVPQWTPAQGVCLARPLRCTSRKLPDTAQALWQDFARYVRSQKGLMPRLQRMRDKERQMQSHIFWLQVQRAVLLRMRYIFHRVAARLLLHNSKRSWLKRHHSGLQRLLACEQTPIAPKQTAHGKPLLAKMPTRKHPPLPSWFGISFRPLRAVGNSLPKGAVVVSAVYMKTPAEKAGIQTGDLLYATNNQPLREPYEIRERVMLASHKQPLLLSVIRGSRDLRIKVLLRRQTSPPTLKLPPLLGRQLKQWHKLKSVDASTLPPTQNTTALLFFWATWCGPCKAALPALRYWKRKYQARGLRIITVSAEPPSVIQGWLQKHPNAMPFLNTSDANGRFASLLRIRATPTFVLVRQGKVIHYKIGAHELNKLAQTLQKHL